MAPATAPAVPYAEDGLWTDDVQDWFIMEELAARKAGEPRPKDRPRTIVKRSLVERLPTYAALARRFIHPLLVDVRNESFVLYTLLMTVSVLSSAAALLAQFSWWRGIVHVGLVVHFAATYVAILHNSSHKPTYGKVRARPVRGHRRTFFLPSVWVRLTPVWWPWQAYALLEGVIPYLLAPFMGHTWNTYYYHHVKHHHVEDNGPNDLSCTLRYQRDHFGHFCIYFLRFLLLTAIELPIYFLRRRQYWNAAATFGGEVASLTIAGVCAQYNPMAALCVFAVPLVVVRFGMMSGNWGQHAFVAQDDPRNNYKSSTICVRHAYNLVAYNDGYHTSHHLNPRRHWADHTNYFLGELDAFYRHGTIVLRDCDFMAVWIMLMLRQYDRMADLYVHCGPESARPPRAEIIALLKSRVQQFSEATIRTHYPNYDVLELAKAD
jgi:hypothetical protein